MDKVIVIPKPKKLELLPEDLTPYLVQRKFNGVGCIVIVDKDNNIQLFSRNVNAVGCHIDYTKKLQSIGIYLHTKCVTKKDSILYGEVIYDSSTWSSKIERYPYTKLKMKEEPNLVMSILNSTHSGQATLELILLEVFKWDGKDVTQKTNTERYEILHSMIEPSTPAPRDVSIPDLITENNGINLMKTLVRQDTTYPLRSQMEGVVLKQKLGHISYLETDKMPSTPRYASQFKFVLRYVTEVIITGYRLSTHNPGIIASYEMCWVDKDSKDLVYIGHCAGLDDKEKDLKKKRGQLYLPFVAKVKYKSITKDGKLLNAIFIGREPSKNWWDCISEDAKKL